MPQRGRPPQPGTAEEKAAIRREKVRLYVKAHRERKKNAELVASSSSPESRQSKSSSPPSVDDDQSTRASSLGSTGQDDTTEVQCVSVVAKDPPQIESTTSTKQLIIVKPKPKPNPPKVSITITPQGNKELGLALLGTFRGQFLPAAVRVPSRSEYGSELVTPCSAWITQAYAIAVSQDSGALKSSLLAIGLALTSMQHQDQRLRMASLDVYRKALRQVRNDIKPLASGKGTNYLVPYLSCLATAMFEMVHDGFSENIVQHVKGAVSLMELLPRDKSVNYLLKDLLLEDLCMWEIVFALKYRYPSPLRAIRQGRGARNYRVDGETKTSSRNATTLGDLLDCADEISTIMAEIDKLKKIPSSDLKRKDLRSALGRLDRILKSFEAWIARFQRRFGSAYVRVGSDKESGLPVTQFLSYEIAAAWVYCLTFQICAMETNIETLNEMLRSLAPSKNPTPKPPGAGGELPLLVQSLETAEIESRKVDKTLGIRQDPVMKGISIHEKLQDTREQLRLTASELIDALCLFLPMPKGIIGSSLVLFPMDRAKAILKREIARLQDDQVNEKDDLSTMADLNDMFRSMKVYDGLEKALAQFGMPPMPDD